MCQPNLLLLYLFYSDRQFEAKLTHFIAKKADMIFEKIDDADRSRLHHHREAGMFVLFTD